ncbi:MAG: hypothetical protein NAOJABEB_00110 [Steroidobacteraceae bacterium]|nr:hypothetical protein [Steroidobacteraceae bacterium]
MGDYTICVRCVMDTSDPEIEFDGQGVCNHCRKFDLEAPRRWFPNEEGARRLAATLNTIKAEGKGKPYDSILGLSGGVDSSFLALMLHRWDLRPLVVHVDAGWNSELAVANIEKVVKHCNFDLHTHVVDWEEMRDLQLAYLKSGVANQDVPQDHVFFASLYQYAVRNGIRFVISGGNFATEGIFPTSWHGSAMDSINLRAIHRQFGERKLKSYSTISFFEYYIAFPFLRRMRVIRPLNFIPYTKTQAIEQLEAIGWRAYGRKHGESVFTKFFQNYYLPTRFGYDKRRPHLSSLIVSGQMKREQAIAELEEPLYDKVELERDIEYFCKKVRVSRSQFKELMAAPLRHYTAFRNWDSRHRLLKRLQGAVEAVTGRRVGTYS